MPGHVAELFTVNVNEFECLVCFEVQRCPVRLVCRNWCGAQICEDCVAACRGKCPKCRETLAECEPVPDDAARKRVLSLPTRCPIQYEDDGLDVAALCEWQGPLAEVEAHRVDCPAARTQCPFATFGCKARPRRCQLAAHHADAATAHVDLANAHAVALTAAREAELQAQIKRLQKEKDASTSLVVACPTARKRPTWCREMCEKDGGDWYCVLPAFHEPGKHEYVENERKRSSSMRAEGAGPGQSPGGKRERKAPAQYDATPAPPPSQLAAAARQREQQPAWQPDPSSDELSEDAPSLPPPSSEDWCAADGPPSGGSLVEARDVRGVWCKARALETRGQGEQCEIRLHFLGWKARWDEWVPRASDRIRAIGTGPVELRPGVGAPEAVSEAEVEVLSESESSQTGEAAGSSSILSVQYALVPAATSRESAPPGASNEPPPGWTSKAHDRLHVCGGRSATYKTYHHPQHGTARSVADAWRMHPASNSKEAAAQPGANNCAPGKAKRPHEAEPSDEDDVPCNKCGSRADASRMLLCDGEGGTCPIAYHTYCLPCPLLDAPRGDWFCPTCELRRKAGSGFQSMRQQMRYFGMLAADKAPHEAPAPEASHDDDDDDDDKELQAALQASREEM